MKHKGKLQCTDENSILFLQPTNILLGANFEAKLSDFGLSKVIDEGESDVISEVRGTFGYMDPEYQSDHHVNPSGDVYSFGIVLLQILSGKKVINLNLEKPMSLYKMVKKNEKKKIIACIVFPVLNLLIYELQSDSFLFMVSRPKPLQKMAA